MKPGRKISGWMGIIVMILLVTGCSTVAHIEKDDTVNFSAYKTFAWDSEKTLKARNSNSLIDAKLKAAVEKELEKSGLSKSKRSPDLILDYNVLVENSVKQQSSPVYSRPYSRYFYNPYSRRIYRAYFPSRMMGYDKMEIPYREGTITIHMIDARSNKLVWQGWTSDEVNSQNLNSKEINASVRSIMRKFNAGRA